MNLRTKGSLLRRVIHVDKWPAGRVDGARHVVPHTPSFHVSADQAGFAGRLALHPVHHYCTISAVHLIGSGGTEVIYKCTYLGRNVIYKVSQQQFHHTREYQWGLWEIKTVLLYITHVFDKYKIAFTNFVGTWGWNRFLRLVKMEWKWWQPNPGNS